MCDSNCSNTHRTRVATAMEVWACLSGEDGEDGPNSSCASRQMGSALSLSSFTVANVQAFSDTHYGAAHISKAKHTECRSHVEGVNTKYTLLPSSSDFVLLLKRDPCFICARYLNVSAPSRHRLMCVFNWFSNGVPLKYKATKFP